MFVLIEDEVVLVKKGCYTINLPAFAAMDANRFIFAWSVQKFKASAIVNRYEKQKFCYTIAQQRVR
jgi:hypothetical protein